MMTLEERIEVLENELRGLRRRNRLLVVVAAVALLAVAVPALVVADRAQSQVVRAEGFEVVKDGKTVATLAADSDGGVLNILNKDGKPVAGLGAFSDGGGRLGIWDKDGSILFSKP
jgi:hypothetical protein